NTEVETLVESIAKDAREVLASDDGSLVRPNYRIVHGPSITASRSLCVSWGEYCYEDTLSHLVATVLKNKEEQIRNRLSGMPTMAYVVAIDSRSLVAMSLEPATEYEHRMYKHHKIYFDRLRVFQQHVVSACQAFIQQSHLIRAVLVWRRRRLQTISDEVH